MNERITVKVLANVDEDGKMWPLSLTMPDGTWYQINRVISAAPAYSRKEGGSGTRYVCQIESTRFVLYFDRMWWIETK